VLQSFKGGQSEQGFDSATVSSIRGHQIACFRRGFETVRPLIREPMKAPFVDSGDACDPEQPTSTECTNSLTLTAKVRIQTIKAPFLSKMRSRSCDERA
jgi:hypothetical protein